MPEGLRVVVSINEDVLGKLREQLSPQQFKQACYQAVKRTTNAGRKIVREEVQKTLNVSNKYFNKVIETYVGSVDDGTALGRLTVTREPIPLIGFTGAKATKSGVRVQVDKSKPALLLKHAFAAKVGAGHGGFFTRAKGRSKNGGSFVQLKGNAFTYGGGKLTPRGYAGRLPIVEATGISVASAIGFDRLTQAGERVVLAMEATMTKNLESQLARFTDAAVPV